MKFLFLSLLASGGISSLCPCDTGGSKCSPYCGCARSCVEGETSLLNLQYDQPNRYFIACDSKNQISTTRYLQSVEINGVKCYILDKYNDLDVIESYTAEQFGLINFSSSVLGLTQMKEPLNRAQAAYQQGDEITFAFSASSQYPPNGTLLIPRAIGSNECNAFVPISKGVSTPLQTCRLSQRYAPSLLVTTDLGYKDVEGVYSTPEIDSIKIFFPKLFNGVDKIMLYYYLFNNDFSESTTTLGTPKENYEVTALSIFLNQPLNDNDRYGPGQIPSFTAAIPDMLIDTGKDMFYPFDKAGQSHGYEYGSPMLNSTNSFITIGNSYLRFGSNSDYFITGTTSIDAFDELINTKQLRAAPKGMGNFLNALLTFERNDNDPNDICKLMFYYKKYDLVMNNVDIVQYPNQNLLVYLKAEGNCNATTTSSMHIQTKFIEINSFTNGLSTRTYSEPYSASFGMIFDFMFDSTNDAIRTIGILFCFGLAGTIWVFTGFCLNYSI